MIVVGRVPKPDNNPNQRAENTKLTRRHKENMQLNLLAWDKAFST